jgi:hypothetical protein
MKHRNGKVSPEALEEIKQAIIALHNPGPDDVIELRAPKVNGRKNNTLSGYFDGDHLDDLARAALAIDTRAAGVYITLNPCDDSLLARCANRVQEYADLTTGDKDIARRINLLIDTDPTRASGISASQEEKDAAMALLAAVREWLDLHGWPEPRITADSGNGGHLIYAIDLPNDNDSTELIERVLKAIAQKFADWDKPEDGRKRASVDTSVYNAARISKLYGTLAAKGDNVPKRPHRRARILDNTPDAQPVPVSLLQQVAAHLQDDTQQQRQHTNGTAGKMDMSQSESLAWVKAFCQRHNLAIAEEKTEEKSNRAVLRLAECPFNSDHKSPDSAITVDTNGKIGFHCFHNSCQGYSWQDVRNKFEPNRSTSTRTNGTQPPRQSPPSTNGHQPASTNNTHDQGQGDDASAHEQAQGEGDGQGEGESDLFDTSFWLEPIWRAGYNRFRLNIVTGMQEVNNTPLNDTEMSRMRVAYRNAGWKGVDALTDAIHTECSKDIYHPIQERLNELQWDGQDHIGELARCLLCESPAVSYSDGTTQPLSRAFLLRWLIGAVERAHTGHQNHTLVLAGPQGCGKSFFIRWLTGTFGTEYYCETGVDPSNKDHQGNATQKFIWELPEMESITRRVGIGELKSFLSNELFSYRKPYDRYTTDRPALANFIGSVNPDGASFLPDTTGNRRFLVIDLEGIDRAYEQISVDQVWAHAMALWRAGERGLLSPEEEQAQKRENRAGERETQCGLLLARYFDIGAAVPYSMTSAAILAELKRHGYSPSSERSGYIEISYELKQMGIVQKRGTGDRRVWHGIRPVQPPEPPEPPEEPPERMPRSEAEPPEPPEDSDKKKKDTEPTGSQPEPQKSIFRESSGGSGGKLPGTATESHKPSGGSSGGSSVTDDTPPADALPSERERCERILQMVRAGEPSRTWRHLYDKITYLALRTWLDYQIAQARQHPTTEQRE